MPHTHSLLCYFLLQFCCYSFVICVALQLNVQDTLAHGAVILLMVNFDCDLDRGLNCSDSFTKTFVAISREKFKFRTLSYTPGGREMETNTGIRILTTVGGCWWPGGGGG